MAGVKQFQDLIAWQKAMELVDLFYHISRAFPADERFGLTGQMRRSVVSIPSNIAEGFGRSSTKEFLRFLDIALGSINEFLTQLIIADRQGFIAKPQYENCYALTAEVQRIVKGLINSIASSSKSGVRIRN